MGSFCNIFSVKRWICKELNSHCEPRILSNDIILLSHPQRVDSEGWSMAFIQWVCREVLKQCNSVMNSEHEFWWRWSIPSNFLSRWFESGWANYQGCINHEVQITAKGSTQLYSSIQRIFTEISEQFHFFCWLLLKGRKRNDLARSRRLSFTQITNPF